MEPQSHAHPTTAVTEGVKKKETYIDLNKVAKDIQFHSAVKGNDVNLRVLGTQGV
jgi:hypothetical protein